jgi:D-alanine-D-alanine ligase
MKIAVLSNSFSDHANKEVEEDLTTTGNAVVEALKSFGHDAVFYDVNEKTFELLRKAKIDFAFNVCERFNGNSFFEPHVAAMLELLGIPYTGSGPLALALCMNKIRVKEILAHNGIPTPKWQVFTSRNKKLDPDLKFPLIVKPSCMDNSIGIMNDSVVHNEKELRSKVGYINNVYGQPALVEEFIDGRELAAGVLGNGSNATALPVSEYVFTGYPDDKNKILCYDSKWSEDSAMYMSSKEQCPVEIPKYIEARIRKIALEVYKLLEVRDYGRIDVRLSKDGIPYVLEMNPNPGISADNTLPKAAQAVGWTYAEMINEILIQALDRHDKRGELVSKLEQMKQAAAAQNALITQQAPPAKAESVQ